MADIKTLLIIFLGKIISFISHSLNLGGGGTWPGEIGLLIDKNILSKLTKNLSEKIILVAGTNGKTTTVKMINDIFVYSMAKTAKVIRNVTGGNVLNGIVSSLITNANIKGSIRADWLIFEVDEATLPLVLEKITPKIVVPRSA